MKFSIKVVIFFIALMSFLWVPPPEIDSYRYYEYAATISADEDLFAFMLVNISHTFDFIYYTLFYFATKFYLPFQTVTAVCIYVLLYQVYLILKEVVNQNQMKISSVNFFLLFLMVCTSLSFVNLFGIGRFVCAVMFLSLCFKHFIRKQNKMAYFYLLCSIFTHVGLISYVLLLFVAHYLLSKRFKLLSNNVFILVGIPIFLFSYLWIDFFMSIFSKLWVLKSDYDYSIYFDILEKGNFLSFKLGVPDILMFISVYVFLTVLILNIRKDNSLLALPLVLYVCYAISLGFSQMWVQRTLIFQIPFIGIIMLFYLNQKRSKEGIAFFHFIFLVWFSVFLLNVYSYREMLNFKLP